MRALFTSKYLQFVAAACIIAGCVGLDQLSKHHAQQQLIWHEDPTDSDIYVGKKVELISFGHVRYEPQWNEPYLGLGYRYSRNKGAAFSMLADLSDEFRVPFFYIVSLLAIVLVISYYRSTPAKLVLIRLGLVFILGGALGNLIDRVRFGYVIDFIDVQWAIFGWRHDFAIFNVADVAINIGVAFFLMGLVSEYRQSAKKARQPSSALDASASEPVGGSS